MAKTNPTNVTEVLKIKRFQTSSNTTNKVDKKLKITEKRGSELPSFQLFNNLFGDVWNHVKTYDFQ